MKFSPPVPLPIEWVRKTVSSASSGIGTLPDGRLRCWIEHETVRGVTPKMLVWWFKNLEGDVEIGGVRYNRYRVWHPVDHLFAEYARRGPAGTVGVGSIIHLAEMLNGRPDYLVHIRTEIKKLDETGYIHEPRIHGLRLARMDYEFEQADGGTRYINSLTIGLGGRFRQAAESSDPPILFRRGKGKGLDSPQCRRGRQLRVLSTRALQKGEPD